MKTDPKMLISMNYHVDLWGRRGELSERNVSQWAQDLDAIRELGCHAVCLNIVRWEDRDGAGRYDPLESLDRIMEMLSERALIAEIMCNQWYGGPRLRLDEHVRPRDIDRRPLDALSWHEPAWREEQLDPYLKSVTARYAGHSPSVIYMFGDDLAAPDTSYGPRDADRFRAWLAQRYETLDRLNDTWRTTFSQWDEIEPPRVRETWTPLWDDWCAARRDWIDDCGQGIASAVRRYDTRAASRVHFALMGWYLFVDRDSWGGLSKRFIEPFDLVSTSANFPEELWPLEDALEWIDRCAYFFRELEPEQMWGINDIPGPRGGRLGSRADRYPSAKRLIALVDHAVARGARFLQYDGYTKSLRQTAVANQYALKSHPHIYRELKAYFAGLNT